MQRLGCKGEENICVVQYLDISLMNTVSSSMFRTGVSTQERCRASGKGPEEVHEDAQRAGGPLLREKAERASLVQSGEEKVVG